MFGVVSWEIMIFIRRIPLSYIINLASECLGEKVILLLLCCRLKKKTKKYKTFLFKIAIRVYCLHCLMLRVYTSLTGGYGVLCDTLQVCTNPASVRLVRHSCL